MSNKNGIRLYTEMWVYIALFKLAMRNTKIISHTTAVIVKISNKNNVTPAAALFITKHYFKLINFRESITFSYFNLFPGLRGSKQTRKYLLKCCYYYQL